jgi:hypothetical protein
MRIEPAPDYWNITLIGGALSRLLADGYSEADGAGVFSVLVDAEESEQEHLEIAGRTPSNPHRVLIVVARFPVDTVTKILSA